MAGTGNLPDAAAIWEREPLVISSRRIELPAGELVEVPGVDGLPDPRRAGLALAESGLIDVLLEGGARLAAAWWNAGLVARGVAYLGAKIGGGTGIPPLGGAFETFDDATSVRIVSWRTLGPDMRIDFEPNR